MVQPVASAYSVGAGQTIYAGRFAPGGFAGVGPAALAPVAAAGLIGDSGGFAQSALLGGVIAGGALSAPDPYDAMVDFIASQPAESWTKLNAGKNRVDSVFPPLDLRALYGNVPAPWDRILGAWPSIGWDPINHRLVIDGGGHANSSCNGVLEWRLDDLSWHLAFHDSEMVNLSGARYRSVDFQSTPLSRHTYGNNNYLPILDRYVAMGGATYNDGNGLFVYDTNIAGDQTALRRAACYTLDMSQARQGKVAGQTGSNNKRGAYAGVTLQGANAWNLRDWWNKPANARPTFNGGFDYIGRIDCGTAYLEYNGHDALLYTSTPGTAKSVLLVEFVDDNGLNDLHYFVGGFDGDGEGQGQVAHADSSHQVFLKSRNGGSATTCFRFVDLKRAWGSSNNWRTPTLTGSDLAEFLALPLTECGLTWNPIKGCFNVHFFSPQVWEIYPPAGNPTPDSNWAVVKPTMAPAGPTGYPRSSKNTGPTTGESGVNGKCKWARDLNGVIKVEGALEGDVWFYKPAGWTDPRM